MFASLTRSLPNLSVSLSFVVERETNGFPKNPSLVGVPSRFFSRRLASLFNSPRRFLPSFSLPPYLYTRSLLLFRFQTNPSYATNRDFKPERSSRNMVSLNSSSPSISHASTNPGTSSPPPPMNPPLYTSDSFSSINTLAPSSSSSELQQRDSSPFSSNATTPAPSRPLSFIETCEYDGPTRVGSPEPFASGEDSIKKEKLDMELGGEKEVEREEVSEKAVIVADNEYPEGGLRAYLALVGSTLVLTCTFSISNSFGTFLNYYKLVSFFLFFFLRSRSLTLSRPNFL